MDFRGGINYYFHMIRHFELPQDGYNYVNNPILTNCLYASVLGIKTIVMVFVFI